MGNKPRPPWQANSGLVAVGPVGLVRAIVMAKPAVLWVAAGSLGIALYRGLRPARD